MAEYIEREKAIAICQSHYEHCLKMHDFSGDSVAYDIKSNIQGLPIADVIEVKHGEWITPTKIKSMNIAVPHCSLCGNVPCDKAFYCPYCGAKMDLKEGAEE